MTSSTLPVLNSLTIQLPDWVAPFVSARGPARDDGDRMRLAIELARQNVERGTGGPFGAAVFAQGEPYPLSVGLNCVVRSNNSALHAEVTALMLAEASLQSFTLCKPEMPAYELYTSCDPCAMCLGAIFWSGVRRIVCGADREDAGNIGFDEGPVFPESYTYMRARGVVIETGFLRAEAKTVFDLYHQREGLIYN